MGSVCRDSLPANRKTRFLSSPLYEKNAFLLSAQREKAEPEVRNFHASPNYTTYFLNFNHMGRKFIINSTKSILEEYINEFELFL